MALRPRREDMSFLEFLRKSEASGATGAIAGWLHKRWAQSHPTEARREPLAEFANAYEMQGEQIVAVEYLWRLNDHYYHVPYRSVHGRLPHSCGRRESAGSVPLAGHGLGPDGQSGRRAPTPCMVTGGGRQIA